MNKPMILVTRPDPAGSELCRWLIEAGFETILQPTIAFASPPDREAMATGIKKLGEQDWIVFISPQAVIATVSSMRAVWPVMPPAVKFAAVGSGTASALKQAGYEAVFPREEWSSEGLLAMPEFGDVAGKRMAIVRGVGGRELLEPVLKERGAVVSSVMTYQREVPAGTIVNTKNYVAIVCTSATSVVNLKKMAGESSWKDIKAVPVIVISERIKNIAAELGFEKTLVARNASHQAIVESIKEMNHVRK